jgi:hypothetical protein
MKSGAHLKKVFKKPVHGYADLFGGGFVGEVIVEEDKKPEFIRHKSLKFYVSILGPFFAIHGIDSSIALLQIESHNSELDTVTLKQHMQLRSLQFSNIRKYSTSLRMSLGHFSLDICLFLILLECLQ